LKISLARALVLKKRVIGKLNVLKGRIQTYNSVQKNAVCPYDIPETIIRHAVMTQQLVTLKAELCRANLPIMADIFRLAEAKTEKLFYEGLDCTAGMVAAPYHAPAGTPPTEIIATINQAQRDILISARETEIDTIQQRLDAFNHTTQIEVPEFDLT